jgi:tRNA1Val (adenine37-N6)-methyltransferase
MFRCKQFTVAQDKCAMKVNTDSLILGSWAEPNSAQRIVDIGTGSGILALMMAQKAQALACIDAIEIDDGAAAQAAFNFQNAKWSKQLFIHHSDIKTFEAPYQYDMIITNPPYFDTPHQETKAYSTQPEKRNLARQTSSLNPNELFKRASAMLVELGSMYCMYPSSIEDNVIEIALSCGFALKKVMYVRHSSVKAPYLCVFHFTKRASGLAGLNRQHVLASIAADSRQTLTIKDEQGQYTHEYKALCQPFYLKF